MLILEIKICQIPIKKFKKNMPKILTISEKILNHLINRVEELENVCLNK